MSAGSPDAGKFMQLTKIHEFDIIVFSFLLHFVWEILQAPLFSSLDSVSHWQGVKICLQASIGDVLIALTAFWTTAFVSDDRKWISTATLFQVSVFLFVGLALTILIEFYSTEITQRWSYAKEMPRIPILGTGLSPILQWIFIPLAVIWFIRRQKPAGAELPISPAGPSK